MVLGRGRETNQADLVVPGGIGSRIAMLENVVLSKWLSTELISVPNLTEGKQSKASFHPGSNTSREF